MAFLALLLLSTPTAANEWTEIEGEPGTGCSKGSKYKFFYKPGLSDKLVIQFEGGGCCFDAVTCSLPQYTEEVDQTVTRLNFGGGILDHTDKRNPVLGWSHLYVPYCTADGHGGNNTVKYDAHLTIHHLGRINTLQALNYAFDKVPNPTTTLTMGCSAGSVGSMVWAPYVMKHYTKSTNHHFGDAYAPLFGKTGYNDGIKNWDLMQSLPTWIPSLNASALSTWRFDIASTIVGECAKYYPSSTYTNYMSNKDVVESSFYVDEGCGESCDWSKDMRSAIKNVHSLASNYDSFIGPGDGHCASESSEFYRTTSGGTNGTYLYQWLTDILNGKSVNNQVDCCPAN